MVMVGFCYADTTKVIYITRTDTTLGTRYANVDSIRNDIVNDPMNQLPGIWKVDLCAMADVEGKAAAFWTYYDLIITFGAEEGNGDENGGANDWDTFLDGVFDTLKKPIITRNAWIANGNPMRLGTAARATTSNVIKLDAPTHFIGRSTYTDNANFGDTVWVCSLTDTPYGGQGNAIRGMANNVVTIARWAGERRSDDADTAIIAVVDSNLTNASGTAAPNRRVFFGASSAWRYTSWAVRDMWHRTLRWAIADTTIDTCVTTVMIGREGVDANWMEYSGITCQMSWHYGGFSSGLLTGWDVQDRATVLRARTSAINTQLPDTSIDWAYDIVDAKLNCYIQGIAESAPATVFSCWEGLFEILYDNVALWVDAKVSYQLDSTCSSWLTSDPDTLMNSNYFVYPDHAWNTARGTTRGTDYSTTAFDSVWIQDPIVSNWMIWGNLDSYIIEARDSLSNQGLITHTIGSITGDGEITLTAEVGNATASRVVETPRFDIYLQWRPANSAAPDPDSSIAFNPDSVIFSGYVDGADPDNQILQVYNGSSSEIFTCGTTEESPAVDWLAIQTNIGNGETPFYLSLNPTIDGLTAGYYSTYIKNTCASVSDSPDSAKVVLWVYPVPGRPTGGKIKF